MTMVDLAPTSALEVRELVTEVAELRKAISELRAPARVTREPFTYERGGEHSYIRDRVFAEERNEPDCIARLQRHAQEMDKLAKERRLNIADSMAGGPITYTYETRITPNLTDGYGGYFAMPKWLDQLFATAPRTGRVLGALMPQFDLPPNCLSISVPYISTGNSEGPGVSNAPVFETDVVDGIDQSPVASIAGMADVSLQLLEQSPAGAHLDWAFFKDLDEAYNQALEAQLLYGNGNVTTTNIGNGQLVGLISRVVTNAPAVVPYTSGSPTDVGMYAVLGKAMARVGNNRKQPPEVWLMRTARWAWIGSSPDSQSRPFNLPTGDPFWGGPQPSPFKGLDPTDNYLAGGILGRPVYLDDAIPQTFSGQIQQPVPGGTQDTIIACRPSDLVLLEGTPRLLISREVGAGTLGVRLRYDRYVAAITGRRISGVAFLVDTGMVVQTGFQN